jgi:hypothetical protein
LTLSNQSKAFGYASDITRTLLLGNRARFISKARDIYNIVLDMQEVPSATSLPLFFECFSLKQQSDSPCAY